VTGRLADGVSLAGQETFYRKGGYLFPYLVLILFVSIFLTRRFWISKPGEAVA